MHCRQEFQNLKTEFIANAPESDTDRIGIAAARNLLGRLKGQFSLLRARDPLGHEGKSLTNPTPQNGSNQIQND